jgi:SAM-dependent methyltransferase
MSYEPRTFWEQRLREQFDLRGTGETTMSLAYNRACYALRRETLDRALAEAGIDVAGRRVLDIGSGSGFFVEHFLARGAQVTGLDLTTASVEGLQRRFPQAHFVRADVGEDPIAGTYDLVSSFDVFFHVVDDARWEAALRRAARAVAPGGALVYTDVFAPAVGLAAHNRTRPLERHRAILESEGLAIRTLRPTHVLLNRHLGLFRSLNRLPGLLLAIDRLLLGAGVGRTERSNQLLLATRPR